MSNKYWKILTENLTEEHYYMIRSFGYDAHVSDEKMLIDLKSNIWKFLIYIDYTSSDKMLLCNGSWPGAGRAETITIEQFIERHFNA